MQPAEGQHVDSKTSECAFSGPTQTLTVMTQDADMLYHSRNTRGGGFS